MKMRKMCNILAVVTVIAAVSVILIYGKKIEPSVQNNNMSQKITVIENTTIAGGNEIIKLNVNR